MQFRRERTCLRFGSATALAVLAVAAVAVELASGDPRTPLARRAEELNAMPPFQVVQKFNFAYEHDRDGERLHPYVKCTVKPLIDQPLRDASICRGPDGEGGSAYYLTGTCATVRPDGTADFCNNAGIRLWKSNDGLKWQSIGLVWDITDRRIYSYPEWTGNRWMSFYNIDPERAGRGMVRGVTAPEIHYIKDTFWIVYSMNNCGVGLLRSTTGRAEGPYENVARSGGAAEHANRLLTRAPTPSLFQDDPAPDGAAGPVYVVWGQGWIARLKDDMTGLAEKPRLLTVEPDAAAGDYPMTCGRRGATIVKANGKYHLICEDVNPRLGFNPCRDTFVAVADGVYGPYGPRDLLVPNAGHVSVFRDGEGRLAAAYSGDARDAYALCVDRPTIVPLVWDNFLKRVGLRRWVRTEGGVVAQLQPCWDVTVDEPVRLRDPLLTLDPDGYYYVAGTTGKDAEGMPGVRVWRSKDLRLWKRIQRPGSDDGFIWSARQAEWTSKPTLGKTLGIVHHDLWGPQLFRHRDTYWIPFYMFNLRTTGLLRSTSGRPEGPYECTDFRWPDGAPHLFRGDDGSVYMHFCFGPPRIGRLKADMSGFETRPRDVSYEGACRQGFEGTWIIRVDGWYVLFQSDRPGMDRSQGNGMKEGRKYNTYDWFYSVSKDIMGSWSRPRPCIPHGGTGSVFQDKDGRWWAAMFGADSTAPFYAMLGLVPLEITTTNDDVLVRVADGFPEGMDMTELVTR